MRECWYDTQLTGNRNLGMRL